LNRSVKSVFLFCSVALSLLVTGCGKKTTKVEGTVTYLNAPLPIASITFIDGKGQRVVGSVEQGKFSVPAVPIGDEIKVVVSTKAALDECNAWEEKYKPAPGSEFPKDRAPPQGVELPPNMKPEAQAKLQEVRKRKQMIVPVPVRYEKEETTPLVIKITSGMSDLSITLEK